MIIDIHTHRGPINNQAVSNHSLERAIKSMDELCIQVSISCNTLSLLWDRDSGAKQACDEFEKSRGRIRSYLFYDPLNREESLRVMDAYKHEAAFCGIKIHPSGSGVYGDDERYRPVWEFAGQYGLPILAHTWDVSGYNPAQKYSHPNRFEVYIRAYPGVNLIMAHSGGRYRAIVEAAGLGREYPNVYFDTAGDIHANGFIEYLVGQVGAARVFFGSDCAMMDQRTMLGAVLGAEISIKEKEDILFNNANTFFGFGLHER